MKLTQEQKDKICKLARQGASIGIPYLFGAKAEGINDIAKIKSIDCSGWICWLLSQVGVNEIEGSINEFQNSNPVSEAFSEVGDLIFKLNIQENKIDHVGIVIDGGWVSESEAWVGNVIIRRLIDFKKENSTHKYAGMRELKG